MPVTSAFYSINEATKTAEKRVYHDNSACAAGQDIRPADKRSGTNNYRHCEDCQQKTNQGK